MEKIDFENLEKKHFFEKHENFRKSEKSKIFEKSEIFTNIFQNFQNFQKLRFQNVVLYDCFIKICLLAYSIDP